MITSNKIMLNEGKRKILLNNGKAYLQKLYDDISKDDRFITRYCSGSEIS